MCEEKQKTMVVEEQNKSLDGQDCADHNELKREFMKRFGTYAAGAPLALFVALKPGKTLAASDGGF